MFDAQPVATLSGSMLHYAYDGESAADHAYLIGRSQHLLSRIYQTLTAVFGWKRYGFASSISYDPSMIQNMISDQEDRFNKPAKNALFEFENGKVISFRQDENGLKIDSQKLSDDIDGIIQNLKRIQKNTTVTLQSTVIKPEITLANSNNFGIEELIGEGQSNYSHSISQRIHKIMLASMQFHGVLVPKRDIFSFNSIVGDISSSTGYQPAYIIKGGKTVLGDGGGVCQVSTTLFRAALNSGLPIVERHAHAYRVGYYENDSQPGFDATVFAPSVDFRFKNDTPASILIETDIDKQNNILRFKFYGKKDGRSVSISPVSVYDVQPPPPPLYQDDPTLKKGVQKQVDFAAWGSKVSFEYKVMRGKAIVTQDKFFSAYQPWRAVYLVGTAD